MERHRLAGRQIQMENTLVSPMKKTNPWLSRSSVVRFFSLAATLIVFCFLLIAVCAILLLCVIVAILFLLLISILLSCLLLAMKTCKSFVLQLMDSNLAFPVQNQAHFRSWLIMLLKQWVRWFVPRLLWWLWRWASTTTNQSSNQRASRQFYALAG
jgi:hypothetical protein